MGSVVRRMRKRRRCLGEVRVLRRGGDEGLELHTKVELIRSLIPLRLGRSRSTDWASTTCWASRSGPPTASNRRTPWSRSAARRSTRGRRRTSDIAGWRRRCSTSSRGCDASEVIDTSQLQAALRGALNIKQQPDRMEKAA